MRQPAHGSSQAPHTVRNIADSREHEERGSAVPAGAVLDDPAGQQGEEYEPPDPAAEVPEAIPRGGEIRD